MKLVVFDLDGTLTKTFAVDGECFLQAFNALGIEAVNNNWSDYEHVTDSGVMNEVFMTRFGRPPDPAEILNFVQRFEELLSERYSNSGQDFGEVLGATSLLASLRDPSDWRAAIATGGWKSSARLKIGIAGIDADALPAAFAEDGPSREAIVRAAIERASLSYQQNDFEKVVSVGDAVWDVRTAKRLSLPFVGVGQADRAVRLRQLGASHIIEDFSDQRNCLWSLEHATVPVTGELQA